MIFQTISINNKDANTLRFVYLFNNNLQNIYMTVKLPSSHLFGDFIIFLLLVIQIFVIGQPALGWNSWNKFDCSINETLIKETANALVSSGLADLGVLSSINFNMLKLLKLTHFVNFSVLCL